MRFVRKIGPKVNRYIGASGIDYDTTVGVPFDVNDERDIPFFEKRNAFEQVEDETPVDNQNQDKPELNPGEAVDTGNPDQDSPNLNKDDEKSDSESEEKSE